MIKARLFCIECIFVTFDALSYVASAKISSIPLWLLRVLRSLKWSMFLHGLLNEDFESVFTELNNVVINRRFETFHTELVLSDRNWS